MLWDPSQDRTLVAAVVDALEPYPWRAFTPALLARCVLAARDRHDLDDLLTGLPGTHPGRWGVLEPVPPDDPRVPALVEVLSQHRWNRLRLPALCAVLLAVPHDPA